MAREWLNYWQRSNVSRRSGVRNRAEAHRNMRWGEYVKKAEFVDFAIARLTILPCSLRRDDHFGGEDHAVNIVLLLQALVRERVGELEDEVGGLDAIRHHRWFEDQVAVVAVGQGGLDGVQGGWGPRAPSSLTPPPPSPRLWHHYPILIVRSKRTQYHIRHFPLITTLNSTMTVSDPMLVCSHHSTKLSQNRVAWQYLITGCPRSPLTQMIKVPCLDLLLIDWSTKTRK